MIDPKQLAAIETFHAASDAVHDVLGDTTEWGSSGQRDGQYAVDLDADAVCIERLHSAGYRVLSEESGITGAASGPVVVVDPLDGSTNASRGVPWFATALCLVDDDGPAAALVADHSSGVRFTAIRGHGAACDDVAISVSACGRLADALVGVSGLPTHHYGWSQFRAFGAAALDICAVASGSLDAWCDMLVDAHGVWDYLASTLVCTEAGGVVGEVMGRELCVLDPAARRTPVVAASQSLFDAVLRERLGSGRLEGTGR
ncbi:MAG TPA: inositol monophosphatase [Ilumatobacteraceae bacterium]